MKRAHGGECALELGFSFGGIFGGDPEGAPDLDELARHPFGAGLVGSEGRRSRAGRVAAHDQGGVDDDLGFSQGPDDIASGKGLGDVADVVHLVEPARERFFEGESLRHMARNLEA
jgi:hypothetical protein